MEVIVQRDPEAAAALAAKLIAARLRSKPGLVLGLAHRAHDGGRL